MLKKGLVLTFLGLLILVIAFHDPDVAPNSDRVNFRVPESNALYFKNLRQFYYEKEEREDARFELFRFKTRPADSTKADVRFAIVSNWLQDEAYIMAEATGHALVNDTMVIVVDSESGREERKLSKTTWKTTWPSRSLYMSIWQMLKPAFLQ